MSEIQLGTGSREPIRVYVAGCMTTDPDRPSSLG